MFLPLFLFLHHILSFGLMRSVVFVIAVCMNHLNFRQLSNLFTFYCLVFPMISKYIQSFFKIKQEIYQLLYTTQIHVPPLLRGSSQKVSRGYSLQLWQISIFLTVQIYVIYVISVFFIIESGKPLFGFLSLD